MRLLKRASVAGAIGLAMAAQSVSAQQALRDFDARGQSDMRATASLTIPLGGKRDRASDRPRLDLALQSVRLGQSTGVTPLRFDPENQNRAEVRATRLSLTLENNPRLLINERRVATFGPTLTADEDEENGGGGDTALYVVGGVLALGVVGVVAVFADFNDAVEDAIGPAD